MSISSSCRKDLTVAQVVATSPTTSRAVPSDGGKVARTDYAVKAILADVGA